MCSCLIYLLLFALGRSAALQVIGNVIVHGADPPDAFCALLDSLRHPSPLSDEDGNGHGNGINRSRLTDRVLASLPLWAKRLKKRSDAAWLSGLRLGLGEGQEGRASELGGGGGGARGRLQGREEPALIQTKDIGGEEAAVPATATATAAATAAAAAAATVTTATAATTAAAAAAATPAAAAAATAPAGTTAASHAGEAPHPNPNPIPNPSLTSTQNPSPNSTPNSNQNPNPDLDQASDSTSTSNQNQSPSSNPNPNKKIDPRTRRVSRPTTTPSIFSECLEAVAIKALAAPEDALPVRLSLIHI